MCIIATLDDPTMYVKYALLVLILTLICFQVVLVNGSSDSFGEFELIRVRDYGSVIVIENVFWIRCHYIYRNVLVMNFSDYSDALLTAYKELEAVDRMLSIGPKTIVQPNSTQLLLIENIKQVLQRHGFKVDQVFVHSNGIIYIGIYRERNITVDLVNEIKEVISRSGLKNVRIILYVLPFNYYSGSDEFMSKLWHAMKAVKEKYGERLGNCSLSLGWSFTALISVHGKLAIPVEQLIDYLREELVDDSTPFTLLFEDVKFEEIDKINNSVEEQMLTGSSTSTITTNDSIESISSTPAINNTLTTQMSNDIGIDGEDNVNSANTWIIPTAIVLIIIILSILIVYLRRK